MMGSFFAALFPLLLPLLLCVLPRADFRAPSVDYDGAVIACGRGVAWGAALLPAYTGKAPIGFRAFTLLASLDFAGGVALLLSAAWDSVYVAYVLFIVFYGLMQFLYAMSSAAVAANVSSNARRTLIFTANTFASLAIQTLTQSIIGHLVLHLTPEGKFYVLAAQLLCLAALFALAALFTAAKFLTHLVGSAWCGVDKEAEGEEAEEEQRAAEAETAGTMAVFSAADGDSSVAEQ